MKCIISRLTLLSFINKIQNVIPTKPAVPVVVNVLLEAVDNTLILSVTDLTLSMRVYLDAKVLEEGAIAHRLKLFFHHRVVQQMRQ